MVILYSYLKQDSNIVACIPFRYNTDNEDKVESREIILEIESTATYDEIKQKLLNTIDKEKMESGKYSDDYTGDMSNVVTIE